MGSNPLKAIAAHVTYELNIIMRSWFFRIFAIIVILLLTGFNLIAFTTLVETPWMIKGMSSFAPYVITMFLNVVQTALMVFMASDVMKRDKKLDSSEVIMIRSMTNNAYIWGKALGLVAVFALLDAVILLISVLLQLTLGAGGFSLMPYIYYPLLIILPSMIFAIGLSFWLMRFVRSQAIVILLLLSLLGVSLFFFRSKENALFDIFAYFIPMAYSDFVGFTSLSLVLMQRFAYFLTGFGLIMWAGFSYERLRQSSLSHQIALVTTALSLLIAAFLAFSFHSHFSDGVEERIVYTELNQQFANEKFLSMDSCAIEIAHHGDEISASSTLSLVNRNSEPVTKFILNLNPGLKVENISADGKSLKFQQKLHLLLIEGGEAVDPGQQISLRLDYSGAIDEDIIFAGIGEGERSTPKNFFLINVDKKHAFINANFLFLPPGSYWYPTPGLPFGALYPQAESRDFVYFRLRVKSGDGLTALASGKKSVNSDGDQLFNPQKPLPFISLVAGDYVLNEKKIDSVNYRLATLRGHDYYTEYFDQIADTLQPLVRDLKQDYERNLELSYPYKKLELVEVPLQFTTYKRLWTAASARVSPQQVFLVEKAVTIGTADFKRNFQRQDRAASDYTLTDREKQYNVLHRFFKDALLGGEGGGRRFGPDADNDGNMYNIFPNYYSFVNYFSGEKTNLFNSALESFLLARTNGENSQSASFESGLSDEEKVSRALNGKNLEEILSDTSFLDLAPDIIRVKGDYLMSRLESNSDAATFNKVTMDFIRENEFKETPQRQLFALWKDEFSLDADSVIAHWASQKSLPRLLMKNPEMYKVYDGDRLRYQVNLQVSNTSKVDALIRVSFRFGGRRQRLIGGDVHEEAPKVLMINANTAKKIGIILDEEPRGINVNYLLADNIPLLINRRFEKTELREDSRPFEGEVVLKEPFRLTSPGEIVVDNESENFTVLDTVRKGFLQRLVSSDEDERDDFVRFRFWSPPTHWRKIKNSGFYGEFIHSALYIRGGQGEKKVQWQADIPAAGSYDVYVYIVNQNSLETRHFNKNWLKENEYTVFHDDGAENISIKIAENEEGWNFLGSFYFSSGPAKIVLSDKSQSRFVIADAVKWVKK